MPFPEKLIPQSFVEVILYFAIVIVMIIIVRLFHYNSIESKVRKTSRCLREQTKGSRSGQYSVTASNAANENMYRVTYNMVDKSYNLDCACKEGETVNNFTNISVYDQRDPANPNKTITSKVCQCDKLLYSTGDRIYYNGYPGLIRYMNSKDSSFFENNY